MSTESLARAWWADAANFDWSIAKVLAELSNRAYQEEPSALRSFEEFGFDGIQPVRFGPSCVWVLHDRSREISVAAFRGTDEVEDWRYNFRAQPVETALGQVHGGFRDLYAGLSEKLLDAVRPIASRGIWLTGHSLGGALANLAAEDLEWRQAIEVRGLVTFGQPMLFDRRAAEQMEVRFRRRKLRFVNDTDAVPRMPPWFAPWGEWLWFRDGLIERSTDTRWRDRADGLGPPSLESSQRTGFPLAPTDRAPGPSPMSTAEYEAFRTQVMEAYRGGSDTNTRLRSIRPLEDHRMTAYLAKITLESERAGTSIEPAST